MKFIKINESQKNRLFEAYQDGFSFKNLSLMADTAFAMGQDESDGQMRYCTKWLGYPDNMGSSRAVYTLNDNMVLKLAYGEWYEAGIAQNKQEFELYQKIDSPLLTKIFYHDKNFTYLVSESVLPCKPQDFEKIVGIPFYHYYSQNSLKVKNNSSANNGDSEVGYNKYFDNIKKPYENSDLSLSDIFMYIECNYVIGEPYNNKEAQEAIRKSKWLQDFTRFVIETQMTDFCQIENFGIVNRDGKPNIVVLDSGLNMDVWERHYKDTNN